MNNIAIKFDHVSKKYFRGGKYQPSLSEWLKTIITGEGFQRSEFKALDKISFVIKKGQAIGIIGDNGAGKSTILKLMARITYPNEGEIEINGKVAGLLELGAGFNGELTGKENVYIYGSILGLNKNHINKIYPKIVNFSELKDFMNSPVKHYSAGMMARLAFSVSIFVEPDILLVDEVLAVGDISFRKKCLKFMKDYSKNSNHTVIFISHSLSHLKKLCPYLFWIEKGKVKAYGKTREIIKTYRSASL